MQAPTEPDIEVPELSSGCRVTYFFQQPTKSNLSCVCKSAKHTSEVCSIVSAVLFWQSQVLVLD